MPATQMEVFSMPFLSTIIPSVATVTSRWSEGYPDRVRSARFLPEVRVDHFQSSVILQRQKRHELASV
jgi:hypothetical protein